jgi:aryl-alcohol dehydrogenase-like predicted oxidoreductase
LVSAAWACRHRRHVRRRSQRNHARQGAENSPRGSRDQELNIGVVAYSPLGRGFLTGAYKQPEDFGAGDYRLSNPRFSSENFAGNLRLVEVVSQIAREEGYTPAQVALAWLLDRAPYIVPIPGTRSIGRLKENALSVMVRLGDAQLERLYGILRERPVSGARYAAAAMVTIDA